MHTITRKIELALCTEGLSNDQRKEQWNLLCHINDNLYKAANNISSKLYLEDHVSSMIRMKHSEFLSLKKELEKARKQKVLDDGNIADLDARMMAAQKDMTEQELAICRYATEMSTQTLSYKFATEIETNIWGQILGCVSQGVLAGFNSDAREVKRGERAIRNYKKGMPIPFPWNKSIRIEANGNEFSLCWYSGIRFKFLFGKDRSNNRAIVRRCLKLDKDFNGEYKLCNSSIQLVKRDGKYKIYLLLVVKIPKEHVELNENIVLGVDLGINVPAYVATNITEERRAIGDREHFLNTRMAFQKRYLSLQKLKGTAGGKGRNKKMEPLEKLRKAERNWVHTQNHLYSRDVVNFAIQTRAATIHLEDLSDFGKDNDGNAEKKKEFVLRNWSYYELQNMITYKAAQYGIKVEKITPAYTSKTCSWCGQQGCRNSTIFICDNPECKQYGGKVHADYNAARNIANSKNIKKK